MTKPSQSITDYVSSLSINQLEFLINHAKEKIKIAKEGERVKVWYVKGACNYYHSRDPLRARAYLSICLEQFPHKDDYLEVSYGFIYPSEVEEYTSGYDKENKQIDEYLASMEDKKGDL